MAKQKLTRGFSVYEARDGWRWRLVVGSRVAAVSGESFASQRNAIRAARALHQRFQVYAAVPFTVNGIKARST